MADVAGAATATTPPRAAARPPARAGIEPNLDILRAFAVACVYYAHLYAFNPRVAARLGRFGVLIFFVHTTLVLMHSMDRLGLAGRSLFKAFYIRRAFRIYPLSIVTVLLLALVPYPKETAYHIKEILYNVLLVQNLTHTESVPSPLWSLPFEIQMYLVLPLLYLAFRSRRIWSVLALWLGSAMLAAPFMTPRNLLEYVPCFISGLVAFRMRPPLRFPGWIWPLFILALSACFGLTTFNVRYTGWVVCLVLGLAIPLFKPVENGVFRWMGHTVATYSYGIYLSHMPLIWFAFRCVGGPRPVRWLILLAASVAVPIVAYHLVEKPCIGLGVRVAKRFC